MPLTCSLLATTGVYEFNHILHDCKTEKNRTYMLKSFHNRMEVNSLNTIKYAVRFLKRLKFFCERQKIGSKLHYFVKPEIDYDETKRVNYSKPRPLILRHQVVWSIQKILNSDNYSVIISLVEPFFLTESVLSYMRCA